MYELKFVIVGGLIVFDYRLVLFGGVSYFDCWGVGLVVCWVP